MPDTRDVRTFATEVKFVVDPALAAGIRQWARCHLAPDPYGHGPSGDEYPDDQRLLRYRAARRVPPPRLVRPQQVPDPSVWRRRAGVPGAQAAGADRPREAAHDDAADRARRGWTRESRSPSWAGHWFHARLAARRLRPVCQVSYRRTARVGMAGGDCIRLTLDEGLAARPSTAAPVPRRSRRRGDRRPADPRAEVPLPDAGAVQASGRGVRADAAVGLEVPFRDGSDRSGAGAVPAGSRPATPRRR